MNRFCIFSITILHYITLKNNWHFICQLFFNVFTFHYCSVKDKWHARRVDICLLHSVGWQNGYQLFGRSNIIIIIIIIIPWMSFSLRLRNSSSCLSWFSSSLKSSSSTSGFLRMHDRNIASSSTCNHRTALKLIELTSYGVNSASYPSRDGKWVVTYELTGEGPVWLIGAVVCLCAASRVQLFVSAGNGWPRDAPRYHWLLSISCHFQDRKRASGLKSDSCKQRYSKYLTFTFAFNRSC